MLERPMNDDSGLDNFDDALKGKMIESEVEGGVMLEDLPVGKTLEVVTEKRTYLIEKRDDGYYISGHPKYCPTPTKAKIPGSTFGGSMIKKDFVGRGMHLEFTTEAYPDPITTTQIKEVTER